LNYLAIKMPQIPTIISHFASFVLLFTKSFADNEAYWVYIAPGSDRPKLRCMRTERTFYTLCTGKVNPKYFELTNESPHKIRPK